MILEVFSSGPAETNAILLACEETRQAVVIDVPFESSPLLLKRIGELQLKIKVILLTHSHWDHTAEVALLKRQLGAPVWIHPLDEGNLRNPGSDGLPLWMPVEGVEPDGALTDNQKISLGHLTIQVLHTPGHTPGGVCFYLESQDVLISGDTLFQGTIGNLTFPTARPKQMGESLKKLAALPPNTQVFPGHGDPTTIGAEQQMLQGYYEQLTRR